MNDMVEHRSPVPELGNTPEHPGDLGVSGPDPMLLAGQRALREAVALAVAGYVLVPVTIWRDPDGKKRAEFHRGWSRGGTTDRDVLRAWSVDHPGCSFAILCGHSGVEVVDLDRAEGGPEWWNGQGLPTSDVVVDTPNGGLHLYWRRRPTGAPADRLVNNAGQVAPGVDARTIGGVVFAPGSYVVGQEDRPYTARGPIPAPDGLEDTPRPVLALWNRVREGREQRDYRPGEIDQARQFTQDEAAAYVATEARDVLMAAQYGLNVNYTLNRAALVVGHFVPEFWTADQAETALGEWLLAGPGARAGWTALDREDLGTIASGLRRGMSEPYARRLAPGSNHLAVGVPVSPVSLPAGTKTAGPDVTSGYPVDPGTGLPAAMLPDPVSARALRVAQEVERLEVRAEAALEYARRTRPADPGPGGTRLAAFLAEPDEVTPYRIGDLWPIGGKVLLSAPAKGGKTTTVMNLVRALVDAGTGARFLGKPQVQMAPAPGADPEWKVAAAGFAVAPLEPGRRVVLLDFEMTRPQLRRWLRGMSIQNLDGLTVELMRGRSWDVRDPHVRTAWARWLADERAEILVVDPIGPVLHGLGIDENDNSAVGGYLAALDALAREAGVSEVLVVHHTGHGGQDGQERARGASSFIGWPDALWTLGRDKATNARGLRADGRDVMLRETVLEFDPATHRLWLGQGSRAQVAGNADAQVVAKLVDGECADRGPGQPGPGVRDLRSVLLSGDVTGESWGKPRAESAIRAARNLGLVHEHPGSMYPGQQPAAKLHHPGSGCSECQVSPA